jgi:hypothetical protein
MCTTKKFSSVMFEALEVADNITPSVLAVAVLAEVKPKALAEMIGDSLAVSNYRSEVAKHLQDVFIKQAVEDEKAEKKGSE